MLFNFLALLYKDNTYKSLLKTLYRKEKESQTNKFPWSTGGVTGERILQFFFCLFNLKFHYSYNLGNLFKFKFQKKLSKNI